MAKTQVLFIGCKICVQKGDYNSSMEFLAEIGKTDNNGHLSLQNLQNKANHCHELLQNEPAQIVYRKLFIDFHVTFLALVFYSLQSFK